jgi:hypothetical protein
VLLDGNVITANRSIDNLFGHGGPGGMLLSGESMLLNNLVSANRADVGGGASISDHCTLVNNLFIDNVAGGPGSAILFRFATARMLHTTLAGDGGDGRSALALEVGSQVVLTNTILVSHTVGISVGLGCSATLESTLWNGNQDDWLAEGMITYTNNYSGTPAFIDAGEGDYHIGPGSMALDRGVEAGVATDIDRQPRPHRAPDLGADEYWPEGLLWRLHLPLLLRGEP